MCLMKYVGTGKLACVMRTVTLAAATPTKVADQSPHRVGIMFSHPNAAIISVAFGELQPTAAIGFPVSNAIDPTWFTAMEHGDLVVQQWTGFSTAGDTLTVIELLMESDEWTNLSSTKAT